MKEVTINHEFTKGEVVGWSDDGTIIVADTLEKAYGWLIDGDMLEAKVAEIESEEV